MMKQMGMNMNEMGDIQRVILQGRNREIVIEGPQVTSIDVQGTTMYQVAGGTETERKLETQEQEVQIPEEDILLVAQQANVSMDKARAALEKTEGDLAQAILNLQTR
jgi:nascent polypeptide-associated complex subunit alpha